MHEKRNIFRTLLERKVPVQKLKILSNTIRVENCFWNFLSSKNESQSCLKSWQKVTEQNGQYTNKVSVSREKFAYHLHAKETQLLFGQPNIISPPFSYTCRTPCDATFLSLLLSLSQRFLYFSFFFTKWNSNPITILPNIQINILISIH